MYFIARRISMPTVEHMLKREKSEDFVALYKGFSKQLNELINLYFSVADESKCLFMFIIFLGKIEEQIAGDAE